MAAMQMVLKYGSVLQWISDDGVFVTGGSITLSLESRKCDFENKNTCGYVQEKKKDKFDWVRYMGMAGSSLTGPATDHTYGTAKGG